MKFWVRAVTDTASEQLLVDASSVEELRSQLELLLHCGAVQRISVTDFHAQVVAKLNDGADIVNVRVETSQPAAPADNGRRVSPRPGRRLSAGGSSSSNNNSTNTGEATRGGSVSGSAIGVGGDGGGGGATPNHGNAATGNSSPLAIGGALGTSPTHAPGSGSATPGGSSAHHSAARLQRSNSGRSLLDPAAEFAPIERLVLKRADLASLIDATFSGAFNDVVSGCFVRIRENAFGGDATGYIVAQIASVHSPSQLLVDLVHFAELRHLDVVSNTGASADEVRTWHRKMLASSRVVPSPVYVEAKADALETALRTVVAMQTPTPPQAGLLGQSPPTSMRRRATLYNLGSLHQQHQAEERPVVGKALFGSTNDMFLNCCVCKTNDTNQWCVYAVRRSNAKSKHVRPGDFSSCVLVFSDDFSAVIEDRDVSIKGVVSSVGAPQLWRGMFHVAAHVASDALCQNSHRNFNAASSEYLALIGRDIKAMYNVPLRFALPVVPWAPDSVRYAPQLLAQGDLMHVFFLVGYVDASGQRTEGLAHAVTTDAKLQAWQLVSQQGPLTRGHGGACFHAGVCEVPASPGSPPPLGHTPGASAAAATPATALRVVFCSAVAEETPEVTLVQNSDAQLSEGRWTPISSVCSVPHGEWRAGGVQSISLFSYKDSLYAALNGEENHRHSTLMIVPVITR